MLLKDLQKPEPKKAPSKVSLSFLKTLCDKYYLELEEIPAEHKRAWNGAYKGILLKINQDYKKFEQLTEYYILICRVLRLKGVKIWNLQVFNIFVIKNNLDLFLSALRIINLTHEHLNHIELTFKIQEDLDGRCKL
jgi:hypothetical protein